MTEHTASLPVSLPEKTDLPGARETSWKLASVRLSPLLQLLLPPFTASVLSLAGVLSVAPAAASLWELWRTDPLKSVGSLLPLVSFVLILCRWRSLCWRREASWWGLLPLVAVTVLVALRQHALFALVLSPSWMISLPPPSLVCFLYGLGCVLFFGGATLLGAALFPVLLLLLVNPVPHVVVRHVDLPLQQASALLARAVALGLGAQLSPGQLRLMFTPEFGMFIAPGCDGMRGSVAMGLLALVAGHLLRMRWRRWGLLVLTGVGLGYLLNLLRLCGLVLYYVLALRIPPLQRHAEAADYAWGALLFSGAAAVFFAMLTRPGQPTDGRAPGHMLTSNAFAPKKKPDRPTVSARSYAVRCAVFVALAGVAAAPFARALWRSGAKAVPSQAAKAATFPARLGSFTLRRTWEERLSTGVLVYSWAEYGKAGKNQVFTVGLSPTLGTHDPLLCHMVRGEAWTWHGDLKLATANGQATFFSTTFLENGVVRTLEAHTLCSAERCGQYTVGHRRFGFILSVTPRPVALLAPEATPPTAVLVRGESTDMLSSPSLVREQLTAALEEFAAVLDPVALSRVAGAQR